jgi:hypothetical protein
MCRRDTRDPLVIDGEPLADLAGMLSDGVSLELYELRSDAELARFHDAAAGS